MLHIARKVVTADLKYFSPKSEAVWGFIFLPYNRFVLQSYLHLILLETWLAGQHSLIWLVDKHHIPREVSCTHTCICTRAHTYIHRGPSVAFLPTLTEHCQWLHTTENTSPRCACGQVYSILQEKHTNNIPSHVHP